MTWTDLMNEKCEYCPKEKCEDYKILSGIADKLDNKTYMYDEDLDDLINMYNTYILRCAKRSMEMEKTMKSVLTQIGVIVKDVYIPKKNNFITISPAKGTLTVDDAKSLIVDLTKSKHITDHIACVETCKDSQRPHIHMLFKHDYAKHKNKNCENHTKDKIIKDIKKKCTKYIKDNVSVDVSGPFTDDAKDIKDITNYIIKPERLKYENEEYTGDDVKWFNNSGVFYEPQLTDYYSDIPEISSDNFLKLFYKKCPPEKCIEPNEKLSS